jgi:hypothetical protein
MMTLKNGTFYKDGVKVPIEFGNKEQIALLEESQELMGDGVLARIDESGDDDHTALEYQCICGTWFRRDYDLNTWNDLQHDTFICTGCGLHYVLDGESFNPFVVVRFDSRHMKKQKAKR